ncbi:MAG: triose-phosphate isomerase [Erythrobacter sp.]
MAQRPFIVGNWKMNGTRAMLSEARAIDRAAQRVMKAEIAIAPPATLIHAVHKEAEQIGVGAQDCHQEEVGAHTGDLAASMVADAGAKFVILGHSERRGDHGETNECVHNKADAALEAGLRIIMCCGESDEVRASGKALDFVTTQLKASLLPLGDAAEKLTVAYEPIWAIGTGKTAAPADVTEMHSAIRALLIELYGEEQGADIRIIYGGSVKPENAHELMSAPEVGGALVGGASLTADSFMGIAVAAADAFEG